MDLNTSWSLGDSNRIAFVIYRFIFLLIKIDHYLKYKKFYFKLLVMCRQNVNLNIEYVPRQMFHASPMKTINIFLIP